MEKVRVEVDLLKPLPTSVFVGAEDESINLTGYVQKNEWENVPKYCKHCRKIGHSLVNCWIVEKMKRDENERKEEEAEEACKEKQRDVSNVRHEQNTDASVIEENWQVPNTKRNSPKPWRRTNQEWKWH